MTRGAAKSRAAGPGAGGRSARGEAGGAAQPAPTAHAGDAPCAALRAAPRPSAQARTLALPWPAEPGAVAPPLDPPPEAATVGGWSNTPLNRPSRGAEARDFEHLQARARGRSRVVY